MSEIVKSAELKWPNGRGELIEVQTLDTDLIELYNKALLAKEIDKVTLCYFVNKIWCFDEEVQPPWGPCQWRVEAV